VAQTEALMHVIGAIKVLQGAKPQLAPFFIPLFPPNPSAQPLA
jgi:hypothetical protein